MMSVEALELKIVKVSHARAQLRLTQQQLAELADVTPKTVSRAETGKPIRLLSAQAILDALNEERQKRNLKPFSLSQLDWVIDEKVDEKQD